MFLSSKYSRILVILVAFIAISQCWVTPAHSPDHNSLVVRVSGSGSGTKTPPKPKPLPGAENLQTPQNKKTGEPDTPGAPSKKAKPFILSERIQKWLLLVKEDLHYVVKSKGGTEGWVQVEFETFVKKKLKITPEQVLREQPVFAGTKNTAKRADWVFDPDSGNEGNTEGLIVELKVQTYKSTEKLFVDLVKADIVKLESDMKPEYKTYNRAVIAIAWDPLYEEPLRKIGALPAHRLELDTGTIVTVYTWEEGHKVKTSEPSTELGREPKLGNKNTPIPDRTKASVDKGKGKGKNKAPKE
jgi:hypothetical protein